ncbi:hypothetical protein HBH56_108840 [Parastagonospora nodorum]|nr:hypothetical protein HBH56_108840 [Parastagonospora nodorum]KAH3922329.1 hypothetical protein HBH54_225940 [Parastagonospora nodorum]KAH3951118.1 hypothetical protein HBH53_064580 [Parastagonospora nodorum]KAH3979422.1 hypothetical protein HBH52_101670 [Parastagonospora nodorum]KAH4035026.1 hypothetical protein HBI09_094240 [Parastagonospora nodorum]
MTSIPGDTAMLTKGSDLRHAVRIAMCNLACLQSPFQKPNISGQFHSMGNAGVTACPVHPNRLLSIATAE